MQLRYYQQDAVKSVYDYLRNNGGNPCVCLPTGTGKSLVIAQVTNDIVKTFGERVLILTHVKELIQQNADTLKALAPELDIGIYSAGLNSRELHNQVIVGGIQSVYNKACDMGAFKLIIIDEAHLIPPDGEGMYQTFFTDTKIVNPRTRILGLTATPFRLKGGLICQPGNILTDICYDKNIKEFINEGFLSDLTTKAGKAHPDFSGLKISGGEFILKAMQELFDSDVVEIAVKEIIARTQDRKKVLIFCAGVEHAKKVCALLNEKDAVNIAESIFGDTPKDKRANIINRFKGIINKDMFGVEDNPIKYLCNVDVLTTGFDAPCVDVVVMLRPTASPGLYVQMVGRGTRIHPDKTNCLVLDFAENIIRHGTVDKINAFTVAQPGGKKGAAPMTVCPHCSAIIFAGYKQCPECGFTMPVAEEEKVVHGYTPTGEPILSGQEIEYTVESVDYNVHEKKGGNEFTPKTMRVDYNIGIVDRVSEWVCPEHTGFAREKFEAWWDARTQLPFPPTAEDAVSLAHGGCLAKPKRIICEYQDSGFLRVKKYIDLTDPTEQDLIAWMAHAGVAEDDIPF